jgi:hypothetical protein
MSKAKARRNRSAKLRAKATVPVSFFKIPGFLRTIASLKLVVATIVQEIIDEMNLALASVGKSFSAGALDEWRPKLTHSVFVRLLNGGNWATDRTNVLLVAHDMAIIASILSGSSPVVVKGRVHAAYRAVKDHGACPALSGGPGGGRWCDFDI